MKNRFKSFLHDLLQRAMVGLPYLSEARWVSEKVLLFLRIWHYLSINKISGDYLEFGVFEGKSFKLSMRAAARFYVKSSPSAPRFFAFDSFSGLPEPDTGKDHSPVVAKGYFSAGPEKFIRNIRSAARGWDIRVIPGFYETSLTREVVENHDISQAAFVNIDCDIYPSTLQALRFVTPLLQNGTALFFDDWFYSGGNMELGEARACMEWLKENPELTLVDFGMGAIGGKVFIVNRAEKGGSMFPGLSFRNSFLES
ncbi:MAG: TylF/MycF/NovP-related O-methyltransferase [Nitrospinota bacterium]|nr:TylF/MycF/NovP-related O-methyltransferase [Nitrospinota bacterium]